MAGVVGERDVERDDIGTGEGDIRGLCEGDLELAGAGFGEEGIVGDDVHVESLGALGELGSDAAHADDGEALAIQLDALESLACGDEVPGQDACVGGADVSRSGEHEGECVLGGGDRVARGRVHHDDAVVGGGLAVDVVNPDTGAADGFEVLGGSENLRSDLRLRADDETVVIADHLDQLVRRHAGFHINGDAFGGAEGFHTFFCNGIGNENAVVCHGAVWVMEKSVTCKRK